jgi:Tetratricopeptide repeat
MNSFAHGDCAGVTDPWRLSNLRQARPTRPGSRSDNAGPIDLIESLLNDSRNHRRCISGIAAWVFAVVQPGAHASDADRILGPIKLTRPLSNDSLERLGSEAESLYKSRHRDRAIDAFTELLELDPLNAQAWFRLGNLYQQSNDVAGAIRAYRKCADTAAQTVGREVVRAKALLNLALLGLQGARQALNELGNQPLADELQAARNHALGQLAVSDNRVRTPNPNTSPPTAAIQPPASPPTRLSSVPVQTRTGLVPELIEGSGGVAKATKRVRKGKTGELTELQADDRPKNEPVKIDYFEGAPGK